MDQVIYADVYFTVNFSMDFLALFVCSRMLHIKPHPFRSSIASSVGALFALFSLLIENYALLSVVLSFAVGIVMCSITFGFSKFKTALLRFGVFMGVSALLAGALSALFSLFNKFKENKNIYVNGTVKELYSEIPLWLFYLLAGISALGAALWVSFGKRRAGVRHADVDITHNGKSVSFLALCDSGDFLCDPISSLPVIVVSPKIMQKLLPGELFALSQKKDPTDALSSLCIEKALKVRLINIKGVADSRLVAAFCVDLVLVCKKRKDALVCCLGDESGFEGYDGIIPEFML